MTVLVTGATGSVGSAVVDGLLAAGERVAVVTRDARPGLFDARVDVREADIARPQTCRDALDGVDRMYLFPFAAPGFVELARDAGVRAAVLLSSMNAAVPGLADPLHKPIEAALEASGMAWTHLRPGEFVRNKLWLWADGIRRSRTVRWPDLPTLASAPVHERDIADVAVAALRDDRHHGRAYVLTGPERLDVREQVDAFAAALGEPVAFEPTGVDETLAELRAAGGFGAAAGRAVLHLDPPSGVDGDWLADPRYSWMLDSAPDAARVLGRPRRTFRQWVAEHVEEVR